MFRLDRDRLIAIRSSLTRSFVLSLGVIACSRASKPDATRDSTPAPPAAVPPSQEQAVTPDSAGDSPAGALRRYYAAIQGRRYAAAYALWSQDGAASGKSLAAFTRGFSNTARVELTVTDSIRTEGAAGSQFATVPVTVDAVLDDGTRQHFTGTYTLRRAMVDGATLAQRTWHIYSAALTQR
jgi:hypothetical protein